MANYIKSEILCEAYTHLNIEDYDSEEKRKILEDHIRDFVLPRASFYFGGEVEVRVVFEEGSLKTRVIIAAIALPQMICAYPSFMQGIQAMKNDAMVVAQSTNLELIFKTRTQHCDRMRIEKRTGVVGRVSDLINRLENISKSLSDTNIPDPRSLRDIESKINELLDWQDDADRLFVKLENDETRACIIAGLLEQLELLREELPWLETLENNQFKSRLIKENAAYASDLKAQAVRYSEALILIKTQFARQLEQYISRLT